VAKAIAEGLEVAHPRLVTATMTKARRTGKVFMDWSQNSGSKTTLAPWSLRGGDRPTAAAPVSWEEVETGAEDPLGLEQMDFREVVRRLETLGDPFAS
jgi:bifunctional non-homologous end joining protein LigD